jgi:alpha-beta hydrolase superfamily lysophospholipase
MELKISQKDFSWKTGDGVELFAQWFIPSSPRGTVAIVHGLGEHCGRYGHVTQTLNEAGLAVVKFDLRGHGKSGGSRGHAPSYMALMDDIQHLLQEAAGRYPDIPLFLYGHSLGGNLILYYAITRKPMINALIVTSPGLAPAFPLTKIKTTAGKILSRVAPAALMDNGLDREMLSRDHNTVEKYNADPLVSGKVSARLGMDIIDNGAWIVAHAKELELPTLLMQGTGDKIVNPKMTEEFAKAAGQNVTLKLWQGYYHELHNEPENAEVLAFMKEWILDHC